MDAEKLPGEGGNSSLAAVLENATAPNLAAHVHVYADAGFTPVLLNANEKTPAFTGWQNMPVAAVLEILRVASNFNLGIAIPPGYFVVDVDIKNGGKGMETLQVWEGKYEALEGMPVQHSCSGGLHYLFALPPGVLLKNAVNIAPGIDIRTVGGFIACEPSEIDGKRYCWEDWDVLNESMPAVPVAPDWLIALCPKPVDGGMTAESVVAEAQTIPEGRRNDSLFRTACALRGQGLNEGDIRLALHSLNDRLCQPPLPASEVAAIAKSAATYFPNPFAAPVNPAPRRDFALKARTAARLFVGAPKAVKWLVERIFPLGKVIILASPPGIGKSFSALELALHVASPATSSLLEGARFSFGGRVLERGRTIYISAEDDEDELHRRLHTLLKGQPMPEHLHIVSLPDQGHFTLVQGDPRNGMKPTEAWAALREEIVQLPDVRLIIVDTFQAVSAGDLNAAEIAQAMMNELVEVANQNGATVIALHHLNKYSSSVQNNLLNAHFAMDTVRGSGAIVGSARAVYTLFPHPKGKEVCEAMGIAYEENKVVYGLVAKANGAARRDYTIYIRDENGVLRDRTMEYHRRVKDDVALLNDELVEEVTKAYCDGRPFAVSKTSNNSLHKRRDELPQQFHQLSANWFVEHAEALVREGRLLKKQITNGKQYVPVVPAMSATDTPAEFSSEGMSAPIKRATKGGAKKKASSGRNAK